MSKAGNQNRENKRFKRYPIVYLHIDISEIRTDEGKAYLFIAVDRTSKSVHAQLYRKMTRQIASEDTLQALAYRAHTVLTDNGVREEGRDRSLQAAYLRCCLLPPRDRAPVDEAPPSLDQRAGRTMNRTTKEATTRAFHYAWLDQLQSHLTDYPWAYKSARPLRALKGKTLIGFLLEQWQTVPQIPHDDPSHFFAGPYT